MVRRTVAPPARHRKRGRKRLRPALLSSVSE